VLRESSGSDIAKSDLDTMFLRYCVRYGLDKSPRRSHRASHAASKRHRVVTASSATSRSKAALHMERKGLTRENPTAPIASPGPQS